MLAKAVPLSANINCAIQTANEKRGDKQQITLPSPEAWALGRELLNTVNQFNILTKQLSSEDGGLARVVVGVFSLREFLKVELDEIKNAGVKRAIPAMLQALDRQFPDTYWRDEHKLAIALDPRSVNIIIMTIARHLHSFILRVGSSSSSFSPIPSSWRAASCSSRATTPRSISLRPRLLSSRLLRPRRRLGLLRPRFMRPRPSAPGHVTSTTCTSHIRVLKT